MTKTLKVLRTCLCLCGDLTQRLYHSGCDQKVRIALARDMANGNLEVAPVLEILAAKTVSDEKKRRVYAKYHAKYRAPDAVESPSPIAASDT